MRQTPTNERVLDERTGGFNTQWQNFLSALETAKVTEDFESVSSLSVTATNAELTAKVNEILAILKA